MLKMKSQRKRMCGSLDDFAFGVFLRFDMVLRNTETMRIDMDIDAGEPIHSTPNTFQQ